MICALYLFDAGNTVLYRTSVQAVDILGISLIARYSYAIAVSSAAVRISTTHCLPGRIPERELWPSRVGSTQNLLPKRLEKLPE